MQGDVEGMKSAEAIAVLCSCGKRLKAQPRHAGKPLKCPACGQPTLVPQATRPTARSADSQAKDEGSGTNRTVMLSLWGCVALVAIGCVLFVKWHSDGLQAARVESADQEISAAVAAADAWIADQKKGQSTEIEQRLARAIEITDATKQADGRSALDRLRARRDLLAQQAAIAEAQKKADGLLQQARLDIEARRLPEAIDLLRKYVLDRHGTANSDAQALLTEAETAVSDMLALNALLAMTGEHFERVKTTGEIRDGRVKHPVLVAVRAETVQRNLEKAVQRREAVRIAAEEEKRREEERKEAGLRAERDAAEKRRRMRENPTLTPQLEDVANFPDRYIGNCVRFERIQVLGDVERYRYLDNVFCVPLRSRRDKYFTGFGDELVVTVSDRMAESLLNALKDNETFFHCDVYCEVGRVQKISQMVTHAKIYKIEVYNLGGKIGKVFSE